MRTYEEDGQVSMFGADSVCSKMFPDFCPPITEKISEPSWKKLQGSQTRPFLFLDLTAGNGQPPEPSSVTASLLRGDVTTLVFGESPRGGEESLFLPTSMVYSRRKSCLSAILERNPDPKYNLSAKACQGILNRAARRGKKLPEALKIALERQARTPFETTTTGGSSMKNPLRSTLVGGGGIDSPTSSRSGDESAVAFSIGSMNSEGMKSDNPATGFYETETGRTLDNNGGNPAGYQGGIAIVERQTGNDESRAGGGCK